MPSHMGNKVLIIRFSSFGDIVQCMSTLPGIEKALEAEIHWVCRSDMAGVVRLSSLVDKVWAFDRRTGLKGLLKMGMELRKEGFTHVYDAHSNIRSRILSTMLAGTVFSRRSKDRWKRILLFRFGINRFPWPFRGMVSYLRPLEKWGVRAAESLGKDPKWKIDEIDALPAWDYANSIALAPSAAWEMKRWPIDHWKALIREMQGQCFIVLGGPADEFCKELSDVAPDRVLNLAGKLSLVQSCRAVAVSKMLISADTGLIHVADILGVKGISLIGPTAFGFPTGKQVEVLSVELPCRPCTKDGRGKCSQQVWQRCMVEITPKMVAAAVEGK